LDYVQPTDLLSDATKAASRKASLPVRDLLIRSFLACGLLAYATSLVFIVLSQNVAPIVGAILFPVGFVTPLRIEEPADVTAGQAAEANERSRKPFMKEERMPKLVVEFITRLIIQALRNFLLKSVRWLPSQGPS
jgi:hypothetical protein